MTGSDQDLQARALKLGRALLVHGFRVGTAESCTGGWIAKVLTDTAGSSQWFEGGIVSYSNAVKRDFLGVPQAELEAHGAVSEPVVRAMAEGARARLGVELAVAVSGIAGPNGGTPDKPVGTVWFAWSGPNGSSAERVQFGGDREAVRRHAVAHALDGLIARVWIDERA